MADDPYFVFSGRYFHSVAVDERASIEFGHTKFVM